MSSSDARMFAELSERVNGLIERVKTLEERMEELSTDLREHLEGKNATAEVLGPEADRQQQDALRKTFRENRGPGGNPPRTA